MPARLLRGGLAQACVPAARASIYQPLANHPMVPSMMVMWSHSTCVLLGPPCLAFISGKEPFTFALPCVRALCNRLLKDWHAAPARVALLMCHGLFCQEVVPSSEYQEAAADGRIARLLGVHDPWDTTRMTDGHDTRPQPNVPHCEQRGRDRQAHTVLVLRVD